MKQLIYKTAKLVWLQNSPTIYEWEKKSLGIYRVWVGKS